MDSLGMQFNSSSLSVLLTEQSVQITVSNSMGDRLVGFAINYFVKFADLLVSFLLLIHFCLYVKGRFLFVKIKDCYLAGFSY